MNELVDSQKTMPFRRRLFVARHRKRSIWVRLWKPFLQAAILVGAPALLGYWALTSPQFTLKEVEVVGASQVARGWIDVRVESYRGRPLVSMPMESVERRLRSHPWVAGVQVRKELPDRLLVVVDEKTPWGVLKTEEEAIFVDASGEAIAPFDNHPRWADLPVIVGEADATVLARAADVASQMRDLEPNWAAGLSRVEVLNDWDFLLETRALPFALVVTATSVQAAVAQGTAYLHDVQSELNSIEVLDLRTPGAIVARGLKEGEE